jgi:3-hydroxybutyryl-CoA dehydrogenase
MRPVCVVGAGTMGRGIAQVALAAGHRVVLCDPEAEQLTNAVDEIGRRLTRKDPSTAAGALQRLATAHRIEQVADVANPLVIEAVVERLDVKVSVLTAAIQRFGAGTILATNTSSLSVTEIAAGVPNPERVVGMHFFNPVPAMRLVEVVRGRQSDEDVVQETAEIARAWGKEVAFVRSSPGFIVNRVARAYYGEALRLVEERSVSPECVDELMRAGNGFRMGPFELMDLIGVEVNDTVTHAVWSGFNFEPRFAPSVLQAEMAAAGLHGRKTCRGFYDYREGTSRALPQPVDAVPCLPTGAVLVGHDRDLATLWRRAAGHDLPGEEGDGRAGLLRLGDLGLIKLTDGRTAHDEAQRRGAPVVLVDRCLDPATSRAVAITGTDHRLIGATASLLAAAGVTAYLVADTPGLIAARILAMIANEAWETVQQGTATAEDVDRAMVLGTNYPCGPIEWARRFGASTVCAVLDHAHDEYRDPRYRTGRGLRVAAAASS